MKKVQFEFTDEAYKAISHLTEITGVRSMAAVIRDALKIYAWLIEEQRAGRKIMSKDPVTEEVKELVPLSIQQPQSARPVASSSG